MKKTIAKSMTAIMAAAMIAGSLTACGGSDNKAETTAAVETTAETTEAVEETTAEAADVYKRQEEGGRLNCYPESHIHRTTA